MKIVNGETYYSKSETAELLHRSPQTLIIWDKRSDKEEREGRERFIPKPMRMFTMKERYWSEEDIETMKLFFAGIQNKVGQAKYGRKKSVRG